MPPLLTLPAVAQAVVDLSEHTGAQSVTARALATELHVSVGALYNYAGSMDHALSAGEDLVVECLAECIERAPAGVSAIHSILRWASDNPGLASLFFDPSRCHKKVPLELCAHFAPFEGPDCRQAFEDFRTWVGLALRQGEQQACVSSMIDAADSLLPAYTAARREAPSGSGSPAPVPQFGMDELQQELKAQAAVGAANEREELVRFHSARIMASGAEQWNFRALSKAANIALAALHSMGSRSDHLQQAGIDLVSAVVVLSNRHNDGLPGAEHLPWAISHMMKDAFQDAASTINRSTIQSIVDRLPDPDPWCTVPVVEMVFAVYVSAHHRRLESTEAWTLAPQLVANFLQRSSTN